LSDLLSPSGCQTECFNQLFSFYEPHITVMFIELSLAVCCTVLTVCKLACLQFFSLTKFYNCLVHILKVAETLIASKCRIQAIF
jgi:hypothetical protein